MSNEKIFIQIAAYRDPGLIPTVNDCISNAKHPENLVFCIAWQHSPDENIDEIRALPNVNIIDINHTDSKGACWARHLIQQKYNDEKYTLQLDSHHRFTKNWDELIIGMYNQLQEMGHKKPLLTSYIPSFDPDNDPQARIQIPWRMDFDRFIPEGAIFFMPASIDNWAELTAPIAARFYSAHFCFTTGSFCLEVPHDPEYYFHGEEISIAARAFTHGYDLFHPHKVVAWHEYTRKNRAKHWDDHNGNIKEILPEKKDWGQRNADCHKRNRVLFSMDGENHDTIDWGKYGFGTERSLRDYEKYAGLLFKKRSVQKETMDRKCPPNSFQQYKTEEEWEESFMRIFKHCIDLSVDSFPHNDYDFWCVAFENKDDVQLNRQDVTEPECKSMLAAARASGSKFMNLWRTFTTAEKPNHWVVWPHSKENGWGEKITGAL